MNQYFIYAIGFTAQILFSARQLTQWISSERAGKILSPLLFWQLSILASFLLMVYGILRNDLAIILGQLVTYGVYIRNLHYHHFWDKIPLFLRTLIISFFGLAIIYLCTGNTHSMHSLINNDEINNGLLIWGILGQLVFTFRFIYQWIYCERRKESILPIGFWIISMAGSIMVLSYAFIRKDPVLIVGQLFGVLVYSRNLMLGYRNAMSFRS